MKGSSRALTSDKLCTASLLCALENVGYGLVSEVESPSLRRCISGTTILTLLVFLCCEVSDSEPEALREWGVTMLSGARRPCSCGLGLFTWADVLASCLRTLELPFARLSLFCEAGSVDVVGITKATSAHL